MNQTTERIRVGTTIAKKGFFVVFLMNERASGSIRSVSGSGKLHGPLVVIAIRIQDPVWQATVMCALALFIRESKGGSQRSNLC